MYIFSCKVFHPYLCWLGVYCFLYQADHHLADVTLNCTNLEFSFSSLQHMYCTSHNEHIDQDKDLWGTRELKRFKQPLKLDQPHQVCVEKQALSTNTTSMFSPGPFSRTAPYAFTNVGKECSNKLRPIMPTHSASILPEVSPVHAFTFA